MNIKSLDDYAWNYRECNFCKKQTPIKEAISTPVDYEYFGTKGIMYVAMCKECHRESQINKLI